MAVYDCRKCPINKYDKRLPLYMNYNERQGFPKEEDTGVLMNDHS